MNIIVDETPIIPYEVYRRYIFGSAYAHVTLCGDVIGPVFPQDKPVILERMFPTGHGRFGKGTEYHAFNLAANTWQLHYYRLTNQLRDNWKLAKEVFEAMNIEYTAVMRRFSSQGNFIVQDINFLIYIGLVYLKYTNELFFYYFHRMGVQLGQL